MNAPNIDDWRVGHWMTRGTLRARRNCAFGREALECLDTNSDECGGLVDRNTPVVNGLELGVQYG